MSIVRRSDLGLVIGKPDVHLLVGLELVANIAPAWDSSNLACERACGPQVAATGILSEKRPT